MARFRKKPVVIEAFQWQGEPIDGFERINRGKDDLSADRFHLVIPTLEGTMYAVEGDWIIKGVKGEYCPCKDEIFRMTYDLVSEADNDSTGVFLVEDHGVDRKIFAELEAERDRLQDEVVALRKDRDRLDWLDDQPKRGRNSRLSIIDGTWGVMIYRSDVPVRIIVHDDIRSAVDFALEDELFTF